MTEKRCCHCKQTLPLADFNRNRSRPDGHQAACRDCQQQSSKAYDAKHRAKKKAASNAWKKANPERRRATNKAYRDAHPEQGKAWREANPEQYREGNRRRKSTRRARLRNAPMGDAADLRSADHLIHTTPGLRCYWCGKPVRIENRHVDHIIPIAQGGAHAAWNLCCSCSRCNMAKHTKLPYEFATGQGELIFGVPTVRLSDSLEGLTG